jgi:hypothetical protein
VNVLSGDSVILGDVRVHHDDFFGNIKASIEDMFLKLVIVVIL